MAEPWQRFDDFGSEPWQRRMLVPAADPQPTEPWQRVEAVPVAEPWQRVVQVFGPPFENWQLRKTTV